MFLVLAALGVGLSEMFTAELFGIIMAAIVFAMALNLMGVWEFEMPSFLGSGKIQALTQDEGALGAFFKGIVTTLLAIPCGAPLLSPALNWLDQQVRPAATGSVYVVFAVIGLGMASPYLIIGAFPELLRFLPKPGVWMDTFKKAMGYCLLVAVVWILYFLPLQDIVPTIGLLFGLWLACWLVGRVPLTASPQTKANAWTAAVVTVAASAVVCFPLLLRPAMQTRLDKYVEREIQAGRAKPKLAWQPFHRAAFESLVAADKTVLVDFTADWCLTCKDFRGLRVEHPPDAGARRTERRSDASGRLDRPRSRGDEDVGNPWRQAGAGVGDLSRRRSQSPDCPPRRLHSANVAGGAEEGRAVEGEMTTARPTRSARPSSDPGTMKVGDHLLRPIDAAHDPGYHR